MYVLMLLLWIVFCGKVTVEILMFGICICAALYWFTCKTLGYSPQREVVLMHVGGKFIKYQFILVWEIIKANIQVMQIVLSPSARIEPQLVRFHSTLKEDTSKISLANSITLTPGTITIGLENGDYLIHALDKKFAGGLDDSIFVKQLTEMEEKINGSV